MDRRDRRWVTGRTLGAHRSHPVGWAMGAHRRGRWPGRAAAPRRDALRSRRLSDGAPAGSAAIRPNSITIAPAIPGISADITGIAAGTAAHRLSGGLANRTGARYSGG